MNKIYTNRNNLPPLTDKWGAFNKENLDLLFEKGIAFKASPSEEDINVCFKVSFTHKDKIIAYRATDENKKQLLRLGFSLEFMTDKEATIDPEDYHAAIGGFAEQEMEIYLPVKKITKSISGAYIGKNKEGNDCLFIIHLFDLTPKDKALAIETLRGKSSIELLSKEDFAKEENFDRLHRDDLPLLVALKNYEYTPREEWDTEERVKTKLLGLFASRLALAAKEVVDEKDKETRIAAKELVAVSAGQLMALLTSMKDADEIDADYTRSIANSFIALLEDSLVPTIIEKEKEMEADDFDFSQLQEFAPESGGPDPMLS